MSEALVSYMGYHVVIFNAAWLGKAFHALCQWEEVLVWIPSMSRIRSLNVVWLCHDVLLQGCIKVGGILSFYVSWFPTQALGLVFPYAIHGPTTLLNTGPPWQTWPGSRGMQISLPGRPSPIGNANIPFSYPANSYYTYNENFVFFSNFLFPLSFSWRLMTFDTGDACHACHVPTFVVASNGLIPCSLLQWKLWDLSLCRSVFYDTCHFPVWATRSPQLSI